MAVFLRSVPFLFCKGVDGNILLVQHIPDLCVRVVVSVHVRVSVWMRVCVCEWVYLFLEVSR